DLVYAYWGLTEALQDRNHENCCITKDLSECLNAKRKKEDVPILTHPPSFCVPSSPKCVARNLQTIWLEYNFHFGLITTFNLA
ncbi:MAG: hypothetical protein IJP75_04535, partial [Bacteroidaceae bacterium]|nr:hypothetical protein [Bacteroidaceae bacterium]